METRRTVYLLRSIGCKGCGKCRSTSLHTGSLEEFAWISFFSLSVQLVDGRCCSDLRFDRTTGIEEQAMAIAIVTAVGVGEAYRTDTKMMKYSTSDDVSRDLKKEATQWLLENFPDWEDPHAYWGKAA